MYYEGRSGEGREPANIAWTSGEPVAVGKGTEATPIVIDSSSDDEEEEEEEEEAEEEGEEEGEEEEEEEEGEGFRIRMQLSEVGSRDPLAVEC